MTPAARAALVATIAVVLAACDDPRVPTPVDRSRTVDLGDGTIASLGPDGRFEVRRDGIPILATPPNAPLFSLSVDPDAPLAWHDPKKDTATFERVDDARIAIDSPMPGVLHLAFAEGDAPAVLVRLTVGPGDGFLTGLGERFDHASARGSLAAMHMELDLGRESGTNDRHVPVPLLVSSRGWGVFVESREAGAFDVGAADPEVVRATFEGRAMSVWIFVARDPLEVCAAFSRHVGLPRPLPRWALGPMLWHNEWTSQADLLGTAAELRKRHIPTTTLWIDNPWQTAYNTFRFDPVRFGDPAAAMAELAAKGFRTIAWSTPYLEVPPGGTPQNEAQDLWVEAARQHYFVRTKDGAPFVAPGFDKKNGFGMLDFTSSGASAFWTGLALRATGAGFSGFKLDYGEDLIAQLLGARLPIGFADGTDLRTARAYPLGYHRAYHAALESRGGGVLVVRASTWGGQTEADIVWPGDLDSGFERDGDPGASSKHVGGLPAAIVAGQTLAVSGFPSFGSDTGGFRHGKPTKEAVLRWAEHTALSLVMQLGGGGDSHDPWTYDEDAASAYAALARLHMRLVPYFSALLRDAEARGTPTLRPLPLAFPDDPGAPSFADDEYMLGPDVLVAPVVRAGVASRTVHFPPGTWIALGTDGSSGDVYIGPRDTSVAAPLGTPLAFARSGALVPAMRDGLDTLAAATDPGTVSAATAAGSWEALGWLPADARATYDDGSALEVRERADGVHVSFLPRGGAKDVTVTLDARRRNVSSATRISGGNVIAAASEAAVRASAESAASFAAGRAVLKIVGEGEIVLR